MARASSANARRFFFGRCPARCEISSTLCCTSPEHGDDDQQLIRHADEAMFKAKRDGGNRTWMTTGP
ncbi:MAG: diguanylate cyclase domain-containing protein [Burkholderiaceae bacterium]